MINKYYIVEIKNQNRKWVVLEVTEKDLKRGINAQTTGLYAFGGLWYGRNPRKIRSYGKILPLENVTSVYRTHLGGLSVDDITILSN